MDYRSAYKKLTSIHQEHIFAFWNMLTPTHRQELLDQIQNLDPQILLYQQKTLKEKGQLKEKTFSPIENYAKCGNVEDYNNGKHLLADAKMGCVIVAGGQGTRLGFVGPKGMYPISTVKKKTLFQIFAEKCLAASSQVNCQLPLAIMTSPATHSLVEDYFVSQNFFGLNKEQLSLFSQSNLPFLNDEGNLILEEPHKIAEGPDGNGNALKHFVEQGIWEKWHKQGVKYINFVLIDNPLADPYDAELLGFHARHNSEITIKCIERLDPSERVGVIVRKDNKIEVVEYSEISTSENTSLNSVGSLKHPCANISLFCFSMDCIKDIVSKKIPLHAAHKSVSVLGKKEMVWKFETFIFDLLPYAKRIQLLIYPRTHCFSPLKNSSGNYSPLTVQEALQAEAKRILEKISGISQTANPLELSQEFYYPTPELLSSWKNRKAPSGYITPN